MKEPLMKKCNCSDWPDFRICDVCLEKMKERAKISDEDLKKIEKLKKLRNKNGK